MEEAINALKEFIIASADEFTSLSDENVTVKAPAEKDIVIGSVDVFKNKNNLIVSIMGETEEELEDADISEIAEQSSIVLTFICRGQTADKLKILAMRYAEAFRVASMKSSTLGGRVFASAIGSRSFYLDSGIVELQMSAVEINFSIITSKEI